ncbi:MAG: hypothetical protein ACE5OR_10945 [bacterium]
MDEVEEPGYYTVTRDGKDAYGNEVASGIYFYRLTLGGADRQSLGSFSNMKRM